MNSPEDYLNTKFPITVCRLCFEENPNDNHSETCSQKFKPKRFVPTPQWISVKDRLPENQQLILTVDCHSEMAVCECKIHLGVNQYIFMLYNTSYQIKHVTHWMDLPEPPK